MLHVQRHWRLYRAIEAKELAERVIRRCLLNLLEAIALTEKYEDFERGESSEGGALCRSR